MSTLKKILLLTIGLFLTSTLTWFILYLFGFRPLVIADNGGFNLDKAIQYPLEAAMFYIQLFLIGSFIVDEYRPYKMLKILYLYMLFDFCVGFIAENFLLSGVLPFAYMFAVCVWKRDGKGGLKRLLLAYFAVAVYQIFAIHIKINIFHFNYNFTSFWQLFVYNVDLLIFNLIIYSIGGEKSYGKSIEEGRKYHIFSGAEKLAKDDAESGLTEWLSELTGFKQLKAISLLLGGQMLQWALILLCCSVGNVLLEGIAITSSFVVYGMVVKRKYHSKSIIACTLLSTLIFYITARISPPYKITQFAPILIALLVTYALYRVALHTEEHERLKSENKHEIKPSNRRELLIAKYNEMGKDEFLYWLKSKLPTSKETKQIMVITYLAEGKTIEQTAELMNYCVSNIKNLRHKAYNKIFTP